MNSFNDCTFKESQEAFAQAIAKGQLSTDPTAPNYAGKWMYMHTDVNGDSFKNIDTRKYIIIK